MNIVSTSLARAVVVGAVAVATALPTAIVAEAGPPPPAAGNWVVIADRQLSVRCTENGQCPPQVIPYTTKQGVLWFDTTVVGSLSCGPGPRLQYSTMGFANTDNLNPLTTGVTSGNETLTITSRCSGGAPLTPASWDGFVRVWYVPMPPDHNNPGGTPAAAHTITGDVDLYDKPGGHGKKIGTLRKGDAVTLNGPCPIQGQGDNSGWCLVDDTTQNRSGAVWGDFVSK